MAVANYMTAPKVKKPTTTPLNPTGQNQRLGMAPASPQMSTNYGQQRPTQQTGQRLNPGAQSSLQMAGGQYSGPMMSTDMGMSTQGRGRDDYGGATPSPQPQGSGGWSLPQWNPSSPQQQPLNPGTQAPRSGSQAFWDSVGPWRADFDDPNAVNRINTLLPVAQLDQNAMQYQQDFNEAQRRWNQEFGVTQNQNQYQQQLSTRQQMSAEEQARLAAAQWQQQFGHTAEMDRAGLGLSQQQINNALLQGNQQYALGNRNIDLESQLGNRRIDLESQLGNRNIDLTSQLQNRGYDVEMRGQDISAQNALGVANIYGGAQRYEADQGLRQAGMYSDAQRYAAQLGLQEAQGYAGAQRYQADQSLREAQGYADAQRFGAQLGLQGQQYQADRGLQEAQGYAGAQMYGADTQFAGTRYESDIQAQIAAQQNQFLYAQLVQQAQQAELERQNQIAQANIFAYGRSPSPNVNWARAWG